MRNRQCYFVDLSKSAESKFSGKHIVAELQVSSCEQLNSIEYLETLVRAIINKANILCYNIQVKDFSPRGVTLIALLTDAHIAVYSQLESYSLFIDAFACGSACDPKLLIDSVIEHINPERCIVRELTKGDQYEKIR